jgi:ABC-type nitrate/sulfonate/bicarbonate transport system substrate-binding protein
MPIRLKLAASLVVCTLALAGCAKDATKPDTGADAMTLNVGQISNSIGFFPLFVAETEGYFKQEGLSLGERPRLGTGAKLVAALQSGSIDVAAGVMTDGFNMYRINDKTRLIESLIDEYYVDVVAGSGIPAANDTKPLIDRIAALKGKKIGITGPGSGTEALMVYLLDQAKLSEKKDVTLVNLGSNESAALGALKSGRVDALSFFQPVGQQAEASGIGRIYISPARGDIPDLEGQLHGAVFTTTDVMSRKGKAIAAFYRAIGKAEQIIHRAPAMCQELLQRYQDTLNTKVVKALVTTLAHEVPIDPAPEKASYDQAVVFHEETGLIKVAPKFDDFVTGIDFTS